MSDTYTKLFSSIVASTIVAEPLATRWVWITMLAMAGADGCVYASMPGLARLANVSREQADTAVASLSSPDQDSRTDDHEGRRIESVDGGWLILNHGKYRAIRSAEERREYMRKYMQDRRAAAHADVLTSPLTKLAMSTDVTPPTPTPTPEEKKEQEQDQKLCPKPKTVSDGFDRFWAAYPRHENKLKARRSWNAKKLDGSVQTIVDDVERRKREHRTWREGIYPHATTYLNGERWKDDINHTPPCNGVNHANGSSSHSPSAVERVQAAILERRGHAAGPKPAG